MDASTVVVRELGPATGDIVLDLGGSLFPAQGWNDFVVVILRAWIAAVARLIVGGGGTERVHFMEGPYEVNLTRLANGMIQLRAMEGQRRVHGVVEVSPLSLAENALTAGREVLRACREQADSSSDARRLEEAVSALDFAVSRVVS